MQHAARRLARDALVTLAVAVAVAVASAVVAAPRDSIERHDPAAKCPTVIGLREARRRIRDAVLAPLAASRALHGNVHPLMRPCNGVLLTGPPGTGKTLLARWTASHVGTFFAVSAGSVQSKWYGETPKIIRRLFETARKSAPCVIFIDELDGLLSARSALDMGAERELKTTMLTEMSRLEHDYTPVIVMAATNRMADIDAAVLRRIRTRIHVPLPDPRTRRSALRFLLPELRECGFGATVRLTHGQSCSDLREIAKAAVISAHARLNDGGFGVTEEDVDRATRLLCDAGEGWT
jgi:SpoVK/Ycf46/Vps4 family AAA+-type ATPase